MLSWFSRVDKLNFDVPVSNTVSIDKNKFPFNSILSCATITNKQNEDSNQDAIATIRNRFQHFNAVIVADGIGGLANGGDAARIAVIAAKDLLSSDMPIDIAEVFSKVQQHLHRIAKQLVDKSLLDQYGTTIIVAIETDDRFKIGYLGNGSIYHVRGNFDHCWSESRPSPTCLTNLLNPHSIQQNGKETLTGYLSPILLYEPSFIELNKDKINGDILILTTDGLGSNDQVQLGKDGNGNWWSRTEMWLVEFLRKIKTELNKENTSVLLKNFLSEMKLNKKLDDDTTIGLIITRRAFSLITSKSEENAKS